MSADIMSFDVFDTLLTRAVGAPSSLFLLLGRLPEVTRMTNCTPEEFARLRIEAERRARSGRREITLHDIYSELGAGLGLPAAQRQQLADCELALERRLSRALPKATSLLKAHGADRRVALSDMYLPAHFVTELLERQGFAELLDRVIVSSEHGVTKSDGGLFGVLIELEQTMARRCRHVGDNPLSDVRVPRLLGLQAEHVPDAALNRYEQIWEQHRWSSGGLSSLFAGASRLARLEADASAELAPIVDVAAGVAAPLLSAYVLWVLASAQREGLKRLYFLARDGEILYLLAAFRREAGAGHRAALPLRKPQRLPPGRVSHQAARAGGVGMESDVSADPPRRAQTPWPAAGAGRGSSRPAGARQPSGRAG
jgi:predicted HAD superfamily hydrolase